MTNLTSILAATIHVPAHCHQISNRVRNTTVNMPSGDITGLKPGTTYHVWTFAASPNARPNGLPLYNATENADDLVHKNIRWIGTVTTPAGHSDETTFCGYTADQIFALQAKANDSEKALGDKDETIRQLIIDNRHLKNEVDRLREIRQELSDLMDRNSAKQADADSTLKKVCSRIDGLHDLLQSPERMMGGQFVIAQKGSGRAQYMSGGDTLAWRETTRSVGDMSITERESVSQDRITALEERLYELESNAAERQRQANLAYDTLANYLTSLGGQA